MKAELTNLEIESIAKKVVEIITNKQEYDLITNGIHDLIKKKVWYLLDQSVINDRVKWDSVEAITLSMNRHFRESDILKDTVKKEISEYFRSDVFKKISISNLQQRIREIEREIEEQNETEND